MKLERSGMDRLEEYSKRPIRPLAERQIEMAFLLVASINVECQNIGGCCEKHLGWYEVAWKQKASIPIFLPLLHRLQYNTYSDCRLVKLQLLLISSDWWMDEELVLVVLGICLERALIPQWQQLQMGHVF